MGHYLVIGGSSGIGLSTVEKLLSKGHEVTATFNNTKPALNHDQLHFYPLDVLEAKLDLDFLDQPINGLVYCPGQINLKPFRAIKPELFIKDYELQVVGFVKVLQAVTAKLVKEGSSIVLFSTVATQMGFNFNSLVSSSKGAIEGLTKSLAAELAPNIRVNAIAPSIVHTPLSEKLLNTEEKIKINAERHPLKRIGESKDIAELAVFLLSENSSWITGQIIHIDGGKSSIST